MQLTYRVLLEIGLLLVQKGEKEGEEEGVSVVQGRSQGVANGGQSHHQHMSGQPLGHPHHKRLG